MLKKLKAQKCYFVFLCNQKYVCKFSIPPKSGTSLPQVTGCTLKSNFILFLAKNISKKPSNLCKSIFFIKKNTLLRNSRNWRGNTVYFVLKRSCWFFLRTLIVIYFLILHVFKKDGCLYCTDTKLANLNDRRTILYTDIFSNLKGLTHHQNSIQRQ